MEPGLHPGGDVAGQASLPRQLHHQPDREDRGHSASAPGQGCSGAELRLRSEYPGQGGHGQQEATEGVPPRGQQRGVQSGGDVAQVQS